MHIYLGTGLTEIKDTYFWADMHKIPLLSPTYVQSIYHSSKQSSEIHLSFLLSIFFQIIFVLISSPNSDLICLHKASTKPCYIILYYFLTLKTVVRQWCMYTRYSVLLKTFNYKKMKQPNFPSWPSSQIFDIYLPPHHFPSCSAAFYMYCFIHTHTFSMFQLDHSYRDIEGTLKTEKECTELNVSLNSQKKSSRNLTF